MKQPIPAARLASLALLCASALAACSDPNATAPQADAVDVATAVADAVEASADTHPLCEIASFADVQQVIGGSIEKVDVIADEAMPSVDCVYLDARDMYNGLSLRFHTSAALVRTASQWPNAAAYVAEWGRTGTPVPDLGDAAAWLDLPSGLLVLQGDTAVHLSSSKADLADPAVRARFEALARRILPRLR